MPTDPSLDPPQAAMLRSRAAVTVRDLDLDYTGPEVVRALRGINLTVQEGEIVALVGETGSGKSSLTQAVLNLLPGNSATRGSVTLDLPSGEVKPLEMTRDEARAFRRSNVAFIPQLTKRALVPVLTVAGHFRQHLPSGLDKSEIAARAEVLLRSVGLSDPRRVLMTYPHQLSGGMAQRVCIALAMSGTSSLVVADEPTSGLDALVKLRVADLLKATVGEGGRTMLLVTHDLHLVQRVATRVAVLYGGCLVEVGPTAELFSRPAHPYTEALVGATPRPGRPLAVLPGYNRRSAAPLERCVFADRCAVKHERCTSEVPPLREVATGREVASWCSGI